MTIAKIGWTTFRVSNDAGEYAPGVLTTKVPNATLVNMRPAVVKEIIINNSPVAGTIEIHDVAQVTGGSAPAATAAKAIIETADIPAGVGSTTVPVDIECKAGFYMEVAGAVDMTVVYRPMGFTSPLNPKVFIQRR